MVRQTPYVQAGSPEDYLLIRTRDGQYALCLVIAVDSRRLEIVWKVRPAGARVDVSDAEHAVAPLHHAATRGDPELVALLLRRGADVNAQTREKRTPLDRVAAAFQNPSAVETTALLLRNGAEVNARTVHGITALHTASYQSTPDRAKLLVESGAIVDARDEKGFTPLHSAVFAGRLDVAEYLIGVGADVNAVDAAGQSLLRYAQTRKKDVMVDLLRRHGAKR